ncbi:MAG: hypothetical protein ABI693_30660 [Bryobacteraceae bacterium]
MLLVVGGQSRKVGKTSVIAGIIRSFREAEWTAIKVTHHHSLAGWELQQESAESGDSGRYLKAGARESWYLPCAPDQLETAMPALRDLIEKSGNVIVESNSVMDYLQPDLYLLVLDHGTSDVKESAQRHWSRVSAFILVEPGSQPAPASVPSFVVTRPDFESKELAVWIAAHFSLQAGGRVTRSETKDSSH